MTETHPLFKRDPLEERTEVLRRKYRKVLWLSLLLAGLLHVFVVFLNPSFTVRLPGSVSEVRSLELSVLRPNTVVVDGRALENDGGWPVLMSDYARADGALVRLWPRAYRKAAEGGSATLRLTVNADGRVEGVELLESEGDRRKDEVFVELAAYFRYSFDFEVASVARVVFIQSVVVSPREQPIG